MSDIKKMFEIYSTKEFLLAICTGAIFYITVGLIVIIPTVTILLLYIPFFLYFMLGIYIAFALINTYFTKIFIETLQQYQIDDTIDYDKLKTAINVSLTIVTFIALAIIYFTIN